jgi:FkbH-like protein
MAKLRELGLDEYFLYPQINWNPKSSSIEKIAKLINIGLDTIAFIDDQPFEREEVQFSLPAVRCIDVTELAMLLDRPDMNPRFLTEDSRMRRQMYLSDIKRQEVEETFSGSTDAFLASLNMIFTIGSAQEDDLQRAEELTVRTNQLNTTGYTYGYEELDFLRQSPQHKLLIAGLEDKYGTYGKIGLTLIECQPDVWTIKLLLMSCRVMSRGVGTILIGHIMNMAREHNVRLHSEFISNDRNRMMYITYKFNGFKEVSSEGNRIIFEADLDNIPPFPSYVDVRILP